MSKFELTKEEDKAIRALKRAFDRLPDTLIVYVVDDVATVCKKGVPSERIDVQVGKHLSPTNMLTDAHDDFEYGEGRDFKGSGWYYENPPEGYDEER